MTPNFLAPDWGGLNWSAFVPLRDWAARRRAIPTGPGVYRVRVVGSDTLAYVGQTGRNLRVRLANLTANALAAEMPFNDPHTAAPRLWSFRDAAGWEYEASAAVVNLSKPDRMALECYLLWQYRVAAGGSTPCNFGRLHPRYAAPRNRKSGARGRRLAGEEPDNTGGASIPALVASGEPGRAGWMGLDWSAPVSLADARAGTRAGVYLLLDEPGRVGYIGQSTDLRNRLRTHAAGPWGEPLRCTTHEFPAPLTPTQLLEVENDLIGSYFASHGAAPRFQFGARGESPAD